jgi:hypothetical protein
MHAWLEQTRLRREAEQQAFEREVGALEARKLAQPLEQPLEPRPRPRRRARTPAEATDAMPAYDAAPAATGAEATGAGATGEVRSVGGAVGERSPAPSAGRPPAPQ